jgi:hypothetical protein
MVEVSNGDIKFIHASTSNGVIISSIKEKKYYSKEFQINACSKNSSSLQFIKNSQDIFLGVFFKVIPAVVTSYWFSCFLFSL